MKYFRLHTHPPGHQSVKKKKELSQIVNKKIDIQIVTKKLIGILDLLFLEPILCIFLVS